MELSSNSGQRSPAQIAEITWGFAPLFMPKSALAHGVFDALEAGSKSVEQLCEETGASERGLPTIVNALIGRRFLRAIPTHSEEIAEWLTEAGLGPPIRTLIFAALRRCRRPALG